MKCSQFDLKDYVFGELSAVQRKAVDQHIASCATCREELERLTVTQAALATMRDEDPPRRIAFVSDKVFEPNVVAVAVELRTAPRIRFRVGPGGCDSGAWVDAARRENGAGADRCCF